MQNQNVTGISRSSLSRHAVDLAKPMPLRQLDPLFATLNQLGVVTSAFLERYRISRRKALEHMAQELVFLQSLYEGTRPQTNGGDPSLQVDAMELNVHLVSTAKFGDYSTAEKINILYQLRRALDILQKMHFNQ